jgi:hypothetical protein
MARRALLAAVASIALAFAVSGGGAAAHQERPAMARHGLNARELALHDAMRKLWEDHITWTRLAIVSFAAGTPDFDATAARLLRNQTDIGNAIKPYYGRKAGNQLTALLKEHINGAVTVLQAARSGDKAAFDAANAAWYRNADDIAHFLAAANPRHWKFKATDRMMRTHLAQTLEEASDRLAGHFAQDVRDYDSVHHHILEMADALSDGIISQFPGRFR